MRGRPCVAFCFVCVALRLIQAKMGNGGSKQEKMSQMMFDLRFTSKQFEKQSKKCQAKEKKAKAQVKKAIQAGNIEGARIYASNGRSGSPCSSCRLARVFGSGIREKNQALNYLRMASRLDAVRSKVESAQALGKLVRTPCSWWCFAHTFCCRPRKWVRSRSRWGTYSGTWTRWGYRCDSCRTHVYCCETCTVVVAMFTGVHFMSQITKTMDQFEQINDDIDVVTGTMSSAMEGTTFAPLYSRLDPKI